VEVEDVSTLCADRVGAQLDALLRDIPPHAIKTGALGSAAIVNAIAERELGPRLVVDPVRVATLARAGQSPLRDSDANDVLRDRLLPKAFLVTPNRQELAELTGIPESDSVTTAADGVTAARSLLGLGVQAVLITGGDQTGSEITDLLVTQDQITPFAHPRIESRNTHGTGCTLSAAITAELAQGRDLPDAIARAQRFVGRAIKMAPDLGHGYGPLNHWASID
jgi:hydroxymethylpyrimidine/phosphomethylpyrimidine kinase